MTFARQAPPAPLSPFPHRSPHRSHRRQAWPAWALATALAGAATGAQAALPDMPDATFQQAVNLANTAQSSTSLTGLSGSVNLTTGATHISLGGLPTVYSDMTEDSALGPITHGGSTWAQLIYSVAFYNPGAGFGFLPVRVGATDTLLATATGFSASAMATSFMEISGWDVSRYFSHCAGQGADGVDPCQGNNATPFSDFNVNMRQNTLYTVRLRVDTQATANYDNRGYSQAAAMAVLDPSFSVIGGAPVGGNFIFSAGVTAVPEPETWALWLGGALLLLPRARRRQGAHA